MTEVDGCLARFAEGFNCAQAVLMQFGPRFGLEASECALVAGALGGGLARTGRACGAVTGALMAVGLALGGTTGDDRDARERTYAVGQEVLRRFEALHGSVECRELLGCDIGTAEGLREARERDLHRTLCPRFVQTAVETVRSLLPTQEAGNG